MKKYFYLSALVIVLALTGCTDPKTQFNGGKWDLAIAKPEYLNSNYEFVQNDINPDRFVFKNITYTKETVQDIQNKIIQELPELNKQKYLYKDLFKRFGAPQYISVYKNNYRESLNWQYGAFNFYIGAEGIAIQEIRVEAAIEGFTWLGLSIGDPITKIETAIGPVLATVEGINDFKDQTLYNNINGIEGSAYFSNDSKGVRVFVTNNKISAIYIYPIKSMQKN